MIDARVRHEWNSQARPGCRREMVRSKQQITTNGELSLHIRFAFLDFSIFPVASPSRHLHFVPSIGTVPPAHSTDSPALHPLHSISLQFRRLHFRSIAFRRPQTGETVRTQIVRARNVKWPRDFVRPASNSPRCFARARHRNTARGSACRRGQAIGRKASPRPRNQQ